VQGSGVTDTIKSGIAKPAAYTDKPELLMYGMMCVLLATGIWLAAATFMEVSEQRSAARHIAADLGCSTSKENKKTTCLSQPLGFRPAPVAGPSSAVHPLCRPAPCRHRPAAACLNHALRRRRHHWHVADCCWPRLRHLEHPL
jgi:hypothetical protein